MAGLPCLQELKAPATPPQAQSSRVGASEAGRQGKGQATAAEGGDQPPSRQDQALQQANPFRSLGELTHSLERYHVPVQQYYLHP